jgi:lipoate---protein ligase
MGNVPLELLDHSFPTLAENLALDEALLHEAEEGRRPPLLRFWECPETAVALGRSSRVADHVDLDACRRDGIPVVRRASGGGVVLVGPGCLAATLILPAECDGRRIGLHAAIDAILERTVAALRLHVPGIEHAGTSDLAVGGRKVSGNAQRWLARMMLHHGTFLYGFPLSLIGRYVQLPVDQPAYRGGRDHAAFLANLPMSRDALKDVLCRAWNAASETPARDLPLEAVSELVRSRYAADEWNLRR